MAKGKSKPSAKALKANLEPDRVELASLVEESDPERFTALEYLVVNGVFWVFCVVNLVVAQWFLGEATGLYFFFGIMATGFTVACLLSYLHDRFYEDDLPETESP